MPSVSFYASRRDANELLRFVLEQPGWQLLGRDGRAIKTLADARGSSFHVYTAEMKGKRVRDEGWGLVQLHLGRVGREAIASSRIDHNSETRARTWSPHAPELGPVEAWNWKAVSRVASAMVRWVNERTVSRYGIAVVLPGAAAARRELR
jgi:hypothetical protein